MIILNLVLAILHENLWITYIELRVTNGKFIAEKREIGFIKILPRFSLVAQSFDEKKNGRFRLDDFISLCIFLQSAR